MPRQVSYYPKSTNFHYDNFVINHETGLTPSNEPEKVDYYSEASNFTGGTMTINHGTGQASRLSTAKPSSTGNGMLLGPKLAKPHGSARTDDELSTVQGLLADYSKLPPDQLEHGTPGYLSSRPRVQPIQRRGPVLRSHTLPSPHPPYTGALGTFPPDYPHGPNASFGPGPTYVDPPYHAERRTTYSSDAKNSALQSFSEEEDDAEVGILMDDEDDAEQCNDIPHDPPSLVSNVFVPRLIERIATQKPSTRLTRDEIISIWEEVIPQVSVHNNFENVIVSSAFGAIEEWRQGFLHRALDFLDALWPTFYVNTAESRRKWVAEMNPPLAPLAAIPFYFREYRAAVVKGQAKPITNGLFQSPFVATTLSGHMEVISRIPEDVRSGQFPAGALVLTIQACKLALEMWRTGDKIAQCRSLSDMPHTDSLFTLASETIRQQRPRILKKILEAAIQHMPRRNDTAGEDAEGLEIVDGDDDH